MKIKFVSKALISLACFTLLTACTKSQEPVKQTDSATVLQEEFNVPQGQEQLYLLHKSLSTKKEYTSDEVILFLEPFSVPTAKAFDVPQYSWMEEYASKGYDTWAMDFRGFGNSSRPKEMSAPALDNPPVIHVDDATQDLETVVKWIQTKRNVSKIHIVGWSYGGVVAGNYAISHPQDINKLVLYGYMHGFTLPMMTKPFENPKKAGQFNPSLPAYQVVDYEKGMHHWHMMIGDKKIVENNSMTAVKGVFLSSDPQSDQNKGAVRRPFGPLEDLFSIWSNKPLYDASKISVPTLVIYGKDDLFADQGMLNKLTGTQEKKEVVIPDATHWAIYEKNRDTLMQETLKFLTDEEGGKK
ncbi:alpha/beta fold hydrolase [Brevibacillus laterosporus]|uniref:Alpha/beta fold hydrolase n=1 Tax=Brevibacillus laterosporus TaxID=1465 RepID=A0A518VEI2_BRELA|nr:alpha/beta fold hydrolase [Brevibacillus laterosporus]